MDPAEDEVLVAARARAAALAAGDETRLRALLHPAFVWSSHRGERFNRAEYLAANCGGRAVWHGQDIRDPRITVVGAAAVLRCVVVDEVDLGAGRPEVFVMPVTQTWVRSDGRWRCLAGHAGPRLSAEP